MKKIYLIKNPDLFQGENYLKTKKNYFEGWYFKNTTNHTSISFIPGIHIYKKTQKAFIQIITNSHSYYIDYDIKDFQYHHKPFWIQIGNNFFSKEGISIDINDTKSNLKMKGKLEYSHSQNIKTNLLYPNIMGFFSYVPFMECNHAILSMKNQINGFIEFNRKKYFFKNGVGYIEKDWGYSFPKSYIWLQGNDFFNKKASFMLSIADIPFKVFHFRGFICVLLIDGKEYRFTTYQHSKIIKYHITSNKIEIVLKRGKYFLHVKADNLNGKKLIAPKKGNMEKEITESIQSKITIILKKKKQIIFSDTSLNSGLEIVKK